MREKRALLSVPLTESIILLLFSVFIQTSRARLLFAGLSYLMSCHFGRSMFPKDANRTLHTLLSVLFILTIHYMDLITLPLLPFCSALRKCAVSLIIQIDFVPKISKVLCKTKSEQLSITHEDIVSSSYSTSPQ